MATTDGLLIDALDVNTYADISDFSGVLGEGPWRGDLITMANQPGALWFPGAGGDTYSFDVPLLMKSDDEDTALGQLATFMALRGTQVTLTRTVAGSDSTCEAVMTAGIPVVWNLEERNLIGCTLIFQNLSGGWTPVAGS